MPEAMSTPSTPTAGSDAGGGGASSSNAVSQAPQVTQPAAPSAPDLNAAAAAAIAGKGSAGVRSAWQATPPAAEAPSNPQASATPATEDSFGFNPAQVQALKRAQLFDPDIISTIPPSNRVAWANKWAEKLSANDRAYAQSKKPGEAQPAEAEAKPGEDDSAATPPTQQDSQPSQATELSDFSEQGITQFVLKSLEPNAEETQSLVDTFGEDGVAVVRGRESRLASAMAQAQTKALAPLVNALTHVLERFEHDDFATGLADLRQQPGYDKLDDSGIQALREAARADVRAKNDPKYRLSNAIKAVASSVFNVDPRLAAQAQLARSANSMLASSGQRPSSVSPTGRPVSEAERLNLAAQAALAGKGREGVAAAYAQ
jgi:hypothetical protein